MKKAISLLSLFSTLLISCDTPKFPPDENKVWYSQNEQENYPNMEIATFTGIANNESFFGYLLYKKEKIKIKLYVSVAVCDFAILYFEEQSMNNEWCWMKYKYHFKDNYMELQKKDSGNPDKFGFNFNNFLPFNLYIKDFNKDEWFAKYPEDKEAKENPNEEKQSNL